MWLSEAPEWSKSHALHSILDLRHAQFHRTTRKEQGGPTPTQLKFGLTV